MTDIQSGRERPTVVTVFAILTLVYVGVTLLLALLPLDLVGGNSPYATPERNPTLQVLDILLALGKGAGAYYLLKMKRLGFYLYTVCEVGVVILSIVYMQQQLDWLEEYPVPSSAPFDPSMAVIGGVGLSLVFSLIWIGVYASNLSKMD